MSKKNRDRNYERRERGRDRNNDSRSRRFNPDVLEFAKWTEGPKDTMADAIKKYRKKSGDFYDSKKEAKYGYFEYLTDRLPEVIEFLLKEGYKAERNNDREISDLVRAIYVKLVDEDFIKYLKKKIKNDKKLPNIKLLPIVIKNIMDSANKQNSVNSSDSKVADTFDMADMAELSLTIMKKKIKKMKEDGIDARIAFDALSCIPCEDALKYSQGFRISSFYTVLYNHAKNEIIPFAEIMSHVVDEEYYPTFIIFALLEKKEKFGSLNEGQKKLYLSISNWCFDSMESMKSDDLTDLIESYISARKRDEKNGRDGVRRYSLSSLSETDYPKIGKVVRSFIADDDSVKKYL